MKHQQTLLQKPILITLQVIALVLDYQTKVQLVHYWVCLILTLHIDLGDKSGHKQNITAAQSFSNPPLENIAEEKSDDSENELSVRSDGKSIQIKSCYFRLLNNFHIDIKWIYQILCLNIAYRRNSLYKELR